MVLTSNRKERPSILNDHIIFFRHMLSRCLDKRFPKTNRRTLRCAPTKFYYLAFFINLKYRRHFIINRRQKAKVIMTTNLLFEFHNIGRYANFKLWSNSSFWFPKVPRVFEHFLILSWNYFKEFVLVQYCTMSFWHQFDNNEIN